MSTPTGICYIDTSALMKFYVKEPGSRRLANWFGPRVGGYMPAVPLYISSLGYPEAMSAITRKRNTGRIAAHEVLGVWGRISMDFGSVQPRYRLIKPDDTVLMKAALLVATHGLRAYDSVHLASALSLRRQFGFTATLTFVTCDIRLQHAAIAEKLVVADPTV